MDGILKQNKQIKNKIKSTTILKRCEELQKQIDNTLDIIDNELDILERYTARYNATFNEYDKTKLNA